MDCHICEHPDHQGPCGYQRAPDRKCNCNKTSLWKSFIRRTRKEAEELAQRLADAGFRIYLFGDGQPVVKPIEASAAPSDYWMVTIYTKDREVLASRETVARWKNQTEKYDAEVARV